MSHPLESEDRLLSAFLQGARHPRLKETFLISYRREGADLHGLYRLGHLARRLRPARGRRAGVLWVNVSDRLLDWRLRHVAEERGLKVIVVQGRACPADAEEALRWLAWERDAFKLQRRLQEEGHRHPTGLDATIRFPRAEVSAAVQRHPELLRRYPSGFRRARAEHGGSTVQQETWVTPEGVDLVAAATLLAQGQGLAFGDALDLVVGTRG